MRSKADVTDHSEFMGSRPSHDRSRVLISSFGWHLVYLKLDPPLLIELLAVLICFAMRELRPSLTFGFGRIMSLLLLGTLGRLAPAVSPPVPVANLILLGSRSRIGR